MNGFRYIGPIGFGRGNGLGGLFDRTRQDQENAQLGAMFGVAPSITPSGGLTYGGLSKSTLMGTARTGMPPTMMADGKKYTLQEDTQSYNRIMAGEREAARRSNRPVQNISPTYRYVDEQGKPFAGTFLGGGSYGGFGGGGPQSSQRSWSNYVEPTGPRNPDYGSNPRRMAMEMAQQSGGPQPARPTMDVEQSIPDRSMGVTGNPFEFTPFASSFGIGPTATAVIPEQRLRFPNATGGGTTGIMGIPRFPYNY